MMMEATVFLLHGNIFLVFTLLFAISLLAANKGTIGRPRQDSGRSNKKVLIAVASIHPELSNKEYRINYKLPEMNSSTRCPGQVALIDLRGEPLADAISKEQGLQSPTIETKDDSFLQFISPDKPEEMLGESERNILVTSTSAKNFKDSNCNCQDVLGSLPSFKNRKVYDKRRRQSNIIFNAFEKAVSENSERGLLGDSEIGIGDDEIFIPLSKTTATTNNGTLWIDPDTDDYLIDNLPDPELDEQAFLKPSPSVIEEQRDTAAATKTIAGTKIPLPSRLKPPTASSSYFSDTIQNAKSSQLASHPLAKTLQKKKEEVLHHDGARTKIPESGIQLHDRVLKSANTSTTTTTTSKNTVSVKREKSSNNDTIKAHGGTKMPLKAKMTTLTVSRLPKPRIPSTAAGRTSNRALQKNKDDRSKRITTKPLQQPGISLYSLDDMDDDKLKESDYLGWLERHPELAFQCGNKLSGDGAAVEGKRKTAMEKHYDSWGDSLSAFK